MKIKMKAVQYNEKMKDSIKLNTKVICDLRLCNSDTTKTIGIVDKILDKGLCIYSENNGGWRYARWDQIEKIFIEGEEE